MNNNNSKDLLADFQSSNIVEKLQKLENLSNISTIRETFGNNFISAAITTILSDTLSSCHVLRFVLRLLTVQRQKVLF